ncbi:MAG: peptide chain release factor N(5)-glutamine methyltransferase [Clostridia bacterium]|nr:peptide chain release factor N(5)-glutamine methyltransferase [Clostridia bacterium]
MTFRALSRALSHLYREREGARFFSERAMKAALLEKAGLSADTLLLRAEEEVDNGIAARLLSDAALLLKGEPLQYYLGTEFFHGREYLVRPEVLIPRADTEVLVELVLEKAPRGALVLDLCCGSGIVGLETVLCREDLRAVGVDLSDAALSLSRDNAEKHGATRISFEKGDVLSPAFLARARALSPVLLAANPPYLTKAEMAVLEDNVRREPPLALDGGEDGLVFYRALLDLSCALSVPLAAEIGWKQREKVGRLVAERGGKAVFYRDTSGRDRAFYYLPKTP